MTEWHGWQIGQRGTLHVGPLPGRKQICVYLIEGSVMRTVAFCRTEAEGLRLVAFLDDAFDAFNPSLAGAAVTT